MPAHVDKIPALGDNYIYMLSWGNNALVVDPGESQPVLDALKGKRLRAILNTHHHGDHVDGNCALKKETGAEVIGPNDGNIPCQDRILCAGEPLKIGPYIFEVIATPGHTKGHIVFYLASEKLLFAGDTLFMAGCGRLFEGTYKEMFSSLKALKKLPGDTKVYSGHEYSETNLKFAAKQGIVAAKDRLKGGAPYIPSTLKEELNYNPFLLAESLEAFTKVRQARDNF